MTCGNIQWQGVPETTASKSGEENRLQTVRSGLAIALLCILAAAATGDEKTGKNSSHGDQGSPPPASATQQQKHAPASPRTEVDRGEVKKPNAEGPAPPTNNSSSASVACSAAELLDRAAGIAANDRAKSKYHDAASRLQTSCVAANDDQAKDVTREAVALLSELYPTKAHEKPDVSWNSKTDERGQGKTSANAGFNVPLVLSLVALGTAIAAVFVGRMITMRLLRRAGLM